MWEVFMTFWSLKVKVQNCVYGMCIYMYCIHLEKKKNQTVSYQQINNGFSE